MTEFFTASDSSIVIHMYVCSIVQSYQEFKKHFYSKNHRLAWLQVPVIHGFQFLLNILLSATFPKMAEKMAKLGLEKVWKTYGICRPRNSMNPVSCPVSFECPVPFLRLNICASSPKWSNLHTFWMRYTSHTRWLYTTFMHLWYILRQLHLKV